MSPCPRCGDTFGRNSQCPNCGIRVNDPGEVRTDGGRDRPSRDESKRGERSEDPRGTGSTAEVEDESRRSLLLFAGITGGLGITGLGLGLISNPSVETGVPSPEEQEDSLPTAAISSEYNSNGKRVVTLVSMGENTDQVRCSESGQVVYAVGETMECNEEDTVIAVDTDSGNKAVIRTFR